MGNLGPVITSLQPIREAVVRLGPLLIVKVNGMPSIYPLTPPQRELLNRRPELAAARRDTDSAQDIAAT